MAIRDYLTKHNTEEILFFLAVVFKPLYLLPSGSFQIGDFLFIAAVAVHFLKGGDRELLLPIRIEEHSLLIFIAGVLTINFFYFIIIGTKDFLLNTAYYLFNFLIVLFAADILQSGRKDTFLCGLCDSCKVVIILQLLVYLIGAGMVDAEGRHFGTFNDPNQYAVYILFCLLIILDVCHEINLKSLSWIIISTVLIISTGSTGSMLGIGLMVALLLLCSIVTINRRKLIIGIISLAVLTVVVLFIQLRGGNIIGVDIIKMVEERFKSKLGRVSGAEDMLNTLINDRIWNRVFEQPKYLLYGAGEGAHERFDTSDFIHEIHSSILGPLFYYGIGFTFFLFRWVYLKLKHADSFQLCLYIAVITESLFLVNYRQPLFWFLFVLAGREKTINNLTVRSINKSEHIDSVIIQEII